MQKKRIIKQRKFEYVANNLLRGMPCTACTADKDFIARHNM